MMAEAAGEMKQLGFKISSQSATGGEAELQKKTFSILPPKNSLNGTLAPLIDRSVDKAQCVIVGRLSVRRRRRREAADS